LSEILLIPGIAELDIIKNIIGNSGKVPVIIVECPQWMLTKITQFSSLMEICPNLPNSQYSLYQDYAVHLIQVI
jgi:hypothetical protein